MCRTFGWLSQVYGKSLMLWTGANAWSLKKNGGLPDLLAVAHACADEVLVPAAAECCGFAGDKGFLAPELTEAATRREVAELREVLAGRDASCYSTCRTCEIGMTRAVGRPYRPLTQLVAETLR